MHLNHTLNYFLQHCTARESDKIVMNCKYHLFACLCRTFFVHKMTTEAGSSDDNHMQLQEGSALTYIPERLGLWLHSSSSSSSRVDILHSRGWLDYVSFYCAIALCTCDDPPAGRNLTLTVTVPIVFGIVSTLLH